MQPARIEALCGTEIAAEAGQTGSESLGGCVGKRVLIVEDEQEVANLVSDVLDFEGYETRTTSGEGALNEALAFEPNVVLLDLMMPVVDGFEVARRLQEHEQTRSMPIVVMTAVHDAPARAAEIGARYFLSKPFDIGDLLTTVEKAQANSTV